MSKNYFGIIDSRNTKYQGSIFNGKYEGIGALIDDLFLYAISNWKNNQIQGPTFIAFPSHQFFFGQIKNKKAFGKCCFQFNQKQKIVFQNNTDRQGPMKIAHIISGESIHFIQKKNGVSSLIDTITIDSSQKQLDGLKQFFGSSIQKQNISFRQFLKQKIVRNHAIVQLSGNNKQTFLGFQKSMSIGIKFEQNSLKSIGNYSQFPRFLQFGRKIVKNSPPNIKIQEGRFIQPEKIITFNANTRPIQALKLTQEYFKQSTSFKNEFTKLDTIDNLYKQMKKMQRQSQQITTIKFGQILLQSSPRAIDGETLTKQYTLDQVKKQIYRAANKKNTSRPDTNRSSQTFIQKYQIPSTREKEIYFQESLKRSREKIIENQIKQFTLYKNKVERIHEEQERIHLLSKRRLLQDIQEDLRAQKQYERELYEELLRQENKNRQVLQQIQNNKRLGLQNNQKKYKRYQYKQLQKRSLTPAKAHELKINIFPIKEQNKKHFLKESKRFLYNERQNDKTAKQISPYERLKAKSPLRTDKSSGKNRLYQQNQEDKHYGNLMKYKERKETYNKYSYLQNRPQNKTTEQPKISQFTGYRPSINRSNTAHQIQRQKYLQSQGQIKIMSKRGQNGSVSPFRAAKRNYRYVD